MRLNEGRNDGRINVSLSARVTPEALVWIKERAKKRNSSMAAVIGLLIETEHQNNTSEIESMMVDVSLIKDSLKD